MYNQVQLTENMEQELICSQCSSPIRKNKKDQWEHYHPNGEVRYFMHEIQPVTKDFKARVIKLRLQLTELTNEY